MKIHEQMWFYNLIIAGLFLSTQLDIKRSVPYPRGAQGAQAPPYDIGAN